MANAIPKNTPIVLENNQAYSAIFIIMERRNLNFSNGINTNFKMLKNFTKRSPKLAKIPISPFFLTFFSGGGSGCGKNSEGAESEDSGS